MPGSKKYRLHGKEFRLIDFDDAFEKFAIGSTIERRSFCAAASGSVGEAELISNCRADMPLECVDIKCAAQNHAVSGAACGASTCPP